MEHLVKVPPHNLEAEQYVLGSMLLDREIIVTISSIIKREDFYSEAHKEIYTAICELFEKSEPVDIITVAEELNKKGILEKVGGIDYITNLMIGVPTTVNVMHYARIIEEKSILRKLIRISGKIIEKSFEQSEEVEHILDFAEKNIFDIIEKRSSHEFVPIKEVLFNAFDRIEFLYKNKGKIVGVPTGFSELDNKTSGFNPSDLILIAARPSMGKTSFALNIALHAAVREKIPVAIFSLEMSKEQLVQRMLCSEAFVDFMKLRTGNLEEEDWERLARVLAPLSEAPIYIDDTPAISVSELRAKARKLKIEKGLGLVMVDYLQLMQGNSNRENRQQEISEISRSLKALARELNVPVVALSQLSRAPESRSDHRPQLSDLRESGAIEQDADLVLFLYRDEYYHPDTDKKNIAEVIIAKQRNGPTGVIELAWLGQYTKFANIERYRTEE